MREGRAVRVLVVEDESVVALDARLRLEGLGYAVVGIADNAADALGLAARENPDLVLMDIRIKGETDGIAAAEALRDMSDVPVVFATAYADDDTLSRAKTSSPYGYIVKPFQERELKIVIELALAKHEYERGMREARDLAEAASRAKSGFLATMSHELMTPLNSIIGFTELAMDGADEEGRGNLAIALESARSLKSLIDSVLEYARLESGDDRVLATDIDPVADLESLLGQYAARARVKGLEISLAEDPGLPSKVRLDGRKLLHAASCLLDNAVKFTGRGFVRLALSRSTLPDGKPSLLIEVSDSGPGIPEGRRDEAFGGFVQLDPSYRRKAGGAGLGLAIAKGLAGLMGGRVELADRPGGGTLVRLEVPCREAGSAAERRDAFRGRTVALAGVAEPCASDMAGAVEALGGRVTTLSGPGELERFLASDPEALALVDEALAPAGPEGAAGSSGRILSLRRRGTGRKASPWYGPFAWYPVGIRKLLIFAAGESPDRDGADREVPARPAKSGDAARDGGSGFAELLGDLRSELGDDRTELDDLARLSTALGKALAESDFEAAERAAQLYRDRAEARGSKSGARAAFAALRAARRSDAAGLAEFERRFSAT
ncbi:MAG TPA: ATP-binding protein [Spirochaetales bacterium]|nr:ATP-binding protein [Spirochaetales bacterium]